MKYSITLDHEIAKAHGWTGTRRRTITHLDGTTETLVFGRKPVELDLDDLPEEILSDSKLIVVDGGAVQLRRAQTVLRKAGVGIPIVAVVKNERHKPERLIGDMRAIQLYEKDILLVNAEAHRYGITWHKTRLRKRLFE